MEKVRTTFEEIVHGIDFEKISRHPNILIAARFWESERFEAAKVCYGLMRSIDDMIDDRKATGSPISLLERDAFDAEIAGRVGSLVSGGAGANAAAEVINRFSIPAWTFVDFARAMRFDLDHDGFATFDEFLEYAGGASVAPSSIFVHLCTLREMGGVYLPAEFDVREAALPCSIFSYIVHIIRDFEEDTLGGLCYFGRDIMDECGVTDADLQAIAGGGRPTTGFRTLVRKYLDLAEPYRLETERTIKRIAPLLEPRYQLSLHVIFSLYLMVWERIDPENGSFTSDLLNPTPDEIRDRVLRVVKEFEPYE